MFGFLWNKRFGRCSRHRPWKLLSTQSLIKHIFSTHFWANGPQRYGPRWWLDLQTGFANLKFKFVDCDQTEGQQPWHSVGVYKGVRRTIPCKKICRFFPSYQPLTTFEVHILGKHPNMYGAWEWWIAGWLMWDNWIGLITVTELSKILSWICKYKWQLVTMIFNRFRRMGRGRLYDYD